MPLKMATCDAKLIDIEVNGLQQADQLVWSFKKKHHLSNKEVTELLINIVRWKRRRGWRNDSLETGAAQRWGAYDKWLTRHSIV